MSRNPTCVPPSVVHGFDGPARFDVDGSPVRRRRTNAWQGPTTAAAVATLLAAALVNGIDGRSPNRMLADPRGYSIYEHEFNSDLVAVPPRTAASSAHQYTATGVADCIRIAVLRVRRPEGESDSFVTADQLVSRVSSAIAGTSDGVVPAGRPVDRIGIQLGYVAAVEAHEVRDIC